LYLWKFSSKKNNDPQYIDQTYSERKSNLLADGVGSFRLVVPDENKPEGSALEVTHLIIRFAKD